ncbi:Ger(x)C family spore germination protein [Bacillus sp. OK048]|uniref:Ger(x)C family spore germination protein n=1 Tax=Bacillus sp. OK048 TaxID=1882761 RepID=UPI000884924D|nr:Ger(x)C family spore germination protein [Bacillus sp. OK048]SDN41577.1 spore germination protein [Bacillus sp. OK048]
MLRKRWLLNLLLSLLLLCGCAEPKILDKLGLVTTGAYDLGENGSILGTAVELSIKPNAANDIDILETHALTIKGNRNYGNKKASKRLVSGQLRVILYGEELLKQGKANVAETLSSDPSISDMTYLAVVDGRARDLLQIQNKHIPDIGLHIYTLMEQNTQNKMMPPATIQEILRNKYTIGKEPTMPILRKEDSKDVLFSGVALFKGSKLVGKINTEQSFYLTLLTDKYKDGSKDVVINSESPKLKGRNQRLNKTVASLDSIRSSSKIKLINKDKPEFNIETKFTARLLEITSPIDVGKPSNIIFLEKEIEKSMKKEIEKLISFLQSKNSDVIGLGDIYRSSVRHSKLTDKKWYKMYKNAKVNVKVDFNIIRTGLND